MPKTIDTLQVVLSDTHTGSNHALFLDREWRGQKNNSHAPGGGQTAIRKHFEHYAEQVRRARKGKRVRLIINGDAIDGDHHHSGDVCSTNPLEQANIHIELISEFENRIDWQRGDEIYYTKGTEIHTLEWENYIGQQMNAVMCGEFYAHELLQLETNGVLSWFVHHGPAAGAGANKGNGLRNWLRNIYFDNLTDGIKIPDIIYTGHVHNPTYSSYIYSDGMKFGAMHGIILPSWQEKSRYAHMRSPVARNKIGGTWLEIKADGSIGIPQFCVMGYK